MIRALSENDLAQCVSVIRTSFLTVANEFGFTVENAPGFTAFSASQERLTQHLCHEHRPMYVFCCGDSIAGYYSLSVPNNHACEINNLCVLPAYRHQSIGTQLLEHACRTAKALNCTTLRISIVEENQVLRAWYESFGFVHTHTRKYPQFPFTCGYMEKHL